MNYLFHVPVSLISYLPNNIINSSDYVQRNGRVLNEQGTGKDVKGGSQGLI
jgi:hypothetical protein